ncbi:putative kinetochore protein NUF2 [Trichoplax sp. H2]|nr:putative kinetochore protein NUF2 [Trichoplax sp. H2]|eukprot:RDD38128.1 putative kinetochore protein NUF2 [Trichoplax sp. H2]
MTTVAASSYAFPILSVADIVNFIKQRFPNIAYVTADDINKPQTRNVKKLYAVFMESLTGFDGNYQPRFAALENCQFADSIQEPLSVVVFSMVLSKVLKDSGVNGVNLDDILSPARKKTIRNLSALINFQRFVDSQIHIFEESASVAESLNNQHQQLRVKSQELDQKITNLKAKKAMEDIKMKDLLPQVENLENELSQFDEQQQNLNQEMSNLKIKTSENENHLIKFRKNKAELDKNVEKLNQRIVASPERLQSTLASLTTRIDDCRKEIEDKRIKNEENVEKINKLSDCTEACDELTTLCKSTLTEMDRYRENVREYEAVVDLRIEKTEALRELNLNVQNLERELQSKRDTLATVRSQNKTKLNQVEKLLEEKQRELADVQKKRHEDNEQAMELSHEMDAIKAEIEKSRNEHAGKIKKAEDTYELLLQELDNYHQKLAESWKEVTDSLEIKPTIP